MSYQCPGCGEKFDVMPFALMEGMLRVEQLIGRCKKCHYDFSQQPLKNYLSEILHEQEKK